MGYRLFLLVALCLFGAGANQKPKKPPEVQVIEAKARREAAQILVDGRVRVAAEKPLHGLVIVFDLMSPEDAVIASMKAPVEDDLISRGEERSYHSVTSDQARAVQYKIRAFDAAEKELRVANTGPFPIE